MPVWQLLPLPTKSQAKIKLSLFAGTLWLMKDVREEVSVLSNILPQSGDVSAVALPVIWLQIARGPGRMSLPAKAKQTWPNRRQVRGRQAPRRDLNRSSQAKLKQKPRLSTEASAGHTEIDWASLPEPPFLSGLPPQEFTVRAPSIPLFKRLSIQQSCQTRTVCWPLSWIQEPYTALYRWSGWHRSKQRGRREFTSRSQAELLWELCSLPKNIHCITVSRPLLSVGQLKGMLDLRFIWDYSAPGLVACSGGLKYVLIEASVMHHLPVVTHAELNALLKAIQAFTKDGTLWNAAKWSKELCRKLPLFQRAGPTKVLPADHQEFTEDPHVSFAAISSNEFLKESSVEIYSLDPDDDSLEFTQPSRDLDAQVTSKDFVVFTFPDSKGRVDSPNSSAPNHGAVSAEAAVAASQIDSSTPATRLPC